MFGTPGGGSVNKLLVDAISRIRVAKQTLTAQVSGPGREGFIQAARITVPQLLDQADANLALVIQLEKQVVEIFEKAEKQVDAQIKAKLGTS